MYSLFTEWAKANLGSSIGGESSVSLDLTIFVRAPLFYDYSPEFGGYLSHIRDVETLDELLSDRMGWQAAPNDSTESSVSSLAIVSDGDNKYVTVSSDEDGSFGYRADDAIFARAFALSIADGEDDAGALVCVFRANEPLFMNGKPGAECRIGASAVPGVADDNPYLFAFSSDLTDQGSYDPAIGPITVSVPASDWEPPRSAHVWMSPQRLNLVVNPSFEYGDLINAWRTNRGTTATIETAGLNRNPRTKALMLSGGPTKVIESTLFPADHNSDWWSVEAAVCGTGNASIGIVFWMSDMNPDGCQFIELPVVPIQSTVEGTETDPSDFTILRGLIQTPPDVLEAMVRITFTDAPGNVFVDDVIADPNSASLGYFDGDWSYGQNGDFGWYGDFLPHSTFSVFYNNRVNLSQQIFGHWEVDKFGNNIYKDGLAEKWTPEGVAVIPHWDDIYGANAPSWYEDVYIPTELHPPGQTVVLDFHTRLFGELSGTSELKGRIEK